MPRAEKRGRGEEVLRSLLCRAIPTTKPLRRSLPKSTGSRLRTSLCVIGCYVRWPTLKTPAAGPKIGSRTLASSIADFARELLMVVDNLQRAIAVAENKKTPANKALLEGIQATLRLFIQTLERFGVRRIEALGRPFDPHLHEAIMTVDDRSEPPGTVVRIVDEGYTIDSRLLRPARVVVTSSQKETPPMPDDNELGSEWGSQRTY